MFFLLCMFQNIFVVVFTIFLVYVFFIYVKLMCYLNKYVFLYNNNVITDDFTIIYERCLENVRNIMSLNL